MATEAVLAFLALQIQRNSHKFALSLRSQVRPAVINMDWRESTKIEWCGSCGEA